MPMCLMFDWKFVVSRYIFFGRNPMKMLPHFPLHQNGKINKINATDTSLIVDDDVSIAMLARIDCLEYAGQNCV